MTELQEDLDRHYPASEISVLGVNAQGEESDNAVASSGTDLPLLQDDQSDVWELWDAKWRDVRVVDAERELRHVVNLTPTVNSNNNLAIQANYDSLRSEIVEAATSERVAESPWQNREEPYDVSNDGFVVPNDVLRVINRINGAGAGDLGMPTGAVQNYYDVTGDNFVTSLDALRIIRHLNRFSFGAADPPPRQTP